MSRYKPRWPPSRPAAADRWWRDFDDLLTSAFREFLILEAAAAQIMIYAPHYIPDLLQTRDYAQATADPGPLAAEPGRLVDFKLPGSTPY